VLLLAGRYLINPPSKLRFEASTRPPLLIQVLLLTPVPSSSFVVPSLQPLRRASRPVSQVRVPTRGQ